MTHRAAYLLYLLFLSSSAVFAQIPQSPPPSPMLSPVQLDDLVAPVALYPDPLLGQILAASTYPLEIAEAQQWLRQNSTLQGAQLMDAARRQNWDASVQALVAFPDALALLSSNIRWTTDLGNAFLAQQSDVMMAVQRMRSRAQANGKLRSTPQQAVIGENQGDQSVIEIQPADPQEMYVPSYDPYYVWGPPQWGDYPDLYYPGLYGDGFVFGPGIFIGGFFPGWGGWGGWGWGCGWFGNGLFVNSAFFSRFGFHSGFGGFRGGVGVFRGGHQQWEHDPAHRMGVAYPNRAVASRFNSNLSAGSRRQAGGSNAGGWHSFADGNRGGANNYAGSYARPGYGGASQGYRGTYTQGYRGGSYAPGYRGSPTYSRSFSPGYSRSPGYSAPRSYSVPRSYSMSRSYSVPRSYSMPRSYSAPRSSGGFSGGHGGGGFSGGHGGFSGGHGGGHGGGGHR